jgi:membrane protease subunit (stomatin/prohibitin family)
VAFKDKRLGLVRLRAFGMFEIRVAQPILLINTLVGTQGIFSTEAIETYISRIIVSRFNDFLGENLDSLFDLPGRYEEISKGLRERVARDLERYGILLSNLYVNSITPPEEVQKAIDDSSRLGLCQDLDGLMKLKAAMAIEKAGEKGGEGLQMGLGLLLPGLFRESGMNAEEVAICPECNGRIPKDSRFCPYCGHQVVIFAKCQSCGKNIPPNAKFCPRCGSPVEAKIREKVCKQCGAVNVFESVFCNQCGERL